MSKQRPASAEKVVESIALISSKPVLLELDRGMKGAIVGILDSLLGSRDNRNRLLFKLFSGRWSLIEDVTTKDLLESEWHALKRWVGPNKPEGEKWQGSLEFVTECAYLNVFFGIDVNKEPTGQEHLTDNPFFEEFCIGRFGSIPLMACGHVADDITVLFNPFCTKCADGGKNKLAYTIAADVPLKGVRNGSVDECE